MFLDGAPVPEGWQKTTDKRGTGNWKIQTLQPSFIQQFSILFEQSPSIQSKVISCFPREKYCSFILDATFSADLRRDLGRACMIISVI